MGYNYRNDGTPDHVDSSQSNASYPHVGIPVTQADATKINPSQRGENVLSVASEMMELSNPGDSYSNKKESASRDRAALTPDPKSQKAGTVDQLKKTINIK